MMDEIMTLAQLKEYIRNMPEDEIISISFIEEADDGSVDSDDTGAAV